MKNSLHPPIAHTDALVLQPAPGLTSRHGAIMVGPQGPNRDFLNLFIPSTITQDRARLAAKKSSATPSTLPGARYFGGIISEGPNLAIEH